MAKVVRGKWLVAGALVAAGLLAAAGVYFWAAGGSRPGPIRRVVLISIDTCRADRLSCYGYGGTSTPYVDALASEGVLFENVLTPVPITLAAHCSMLTGNVPPRHGVRDNYDYQLPASAVTLADMFKEKGYSTGAVVSSFTLNRRFGLEQGFDHYEDGLSGGATSSNERKGHDTSNLAVEWLKGHAAEDFFLFVHYYDPHTPYEAPEPFAGLFPDDPYAAEVAYTDHCVGEVIAALKSLGIYEESLVVVTGDHGEMLGEHGEEEHCFFIYQSALKVPLIFKLPQGKVRGRVTEPAGIVDILPTVCGLCGMEAPVGVGGQDLSGYLQGKGASEKRYLYCESLTAEKYGAQGLQGVTDGRWKYIRSARSELYDLEEDPGELTNLIADEPKRVHYLSGQLDALLAEAGGAAESATSLTVDEQSAARLRSLGYVGGRFGQGEGGTDSGKADAKDVLEVYQSDVKAGVLLSRGQYKEAREVCEELLALKPGFEGALRTLAGVALAQGQADEAVKYLEAVESRFPKEYMAQAELAGALKAAGQWERAADHYRKALAIDGRRGELMWELAGVLVQQKKYDEAADWLRRVVELMPQNAQVHERLGMVLSELGEVEEAKASYARARELAPDLVSVEYTLALESVRSGALTEAVAHALKMLAAGPTSEQPFAFAENLARACLENQQSDEAAQVLEGMLAAQPGVSDWQNKLATVRAAQGQFEEAIKQWQLSLESEPSQAQVHAALGEVYARRGELDLTVGHWRKAIALQPDWPEMLNNLALVQATHKDVSQRNPTEALKLARRACELTGYEQPGYLATLCFAQAAGGDFAGAAATCEKAIALAEAGKQRQMAERLQVYLDQYRKALAEAPAGPGEQGTP